MFTGSHSGGGFLTPGYLLGRQHGRLETIQETPGVCRRWLAGIGWSGIGWNKQKCSFIGPGAHLGCNSHALVEFVITSDMDLAKSKVGTLKFRLCKELLDEISWETVLRNKDRTELAALLRAQELSIPQHKKLSRRDRKPTWLSKDLLVRLGDKTEMHRQQK